MISQVRIKSKPVERCTAFIFGAGAVVNAWTPVLQALQAYYPQPMTIDSANAYLALIVYQLRWFSGQDTEDCRERVKQLKDELVRIRSVICSNLKRAEEEKYIRPREDLEGILKHFLGKSRKLLFVSTNWDTVVDNALKEFAKERGTSSDDVVVHHLHGSNSNQATIYLPSEMTREPYRSKDEESDLGSIHTTIMLGLEEAQTVVLYGLSLAPLDAELMQVLMSGWSNPNLRSIVIVNPAHQEVAERVNILLDYHRGIEVHGVHPKELTRIYDYTVRPGSSKSMSIHQSTKTKVES